MYRSVVTVLCLVALTGCSPAREPVSSPSPLPTPSSAGPSPSVSPSPSLSPAPSMPASFPPDLPTTDPVEAAVIHGWQEYWRVYEKFAADPLGLTDQTETQYVTTGRQSTYVLDSLDSLKRMKVRSEGGLLFRDVAVGEAEVIGGETVRQITYCLDTTELRVINIETGERVARADTYRETATMVKGPDGTWRVEMIANRKVTC